MFQNRVPWPGRASAFQPSFHYIFLRSVWREEVQGVVHCMRRSLTPMTLLLWHD